VIARWERLRAEASAHYEWPGRARRRARELARIDLPLSIYTQWYWEDRPAQPAALPGTARVDAHAQYEIRAPTGG